MIGARVLSHQPRHDGGAFLRALTDCGRLLTGIAAPRPLAAGTRVRLRAIGGFFEVLC
jgi:hypothetical protein